ncbi:MAG: acireductone synthase [Acidobacteriota bacterium]|nr:acireductone synthase [Acidobacteriota bacterium]
MSFKAILLDIEGATTPIDFVHKTLFPFARERMLEFVRDNFGRLQDEIVSLHAEHKIDSSKGEDLAPFDETSAESIARYLIFLIDQDCKSTALKSIQGQIWRAGYETGELRGEVFEDVLPAFKRWKENGKTIAIFSSGSRLAQRLIFGFSVAGDLTSFISAYFDTTTGAKKEAESYRKIAESLGFPPVEILFVSDSVWELDAAFEAGMQTRLSIRPNNPPIEELTAHLIINSFDELE